MEYTVEQLSPVKTQVTVTVPADEANAAIATAVALYRSKADIKGFRKGKVPGSLIESRFKKEITAEATTDLINVHINQIMGELKLSPLAGLNVSDAVLAKDTPLTYTFSFEHAPAFDLPDYKGQTIEEEDVEVHDADVDAVIERVRKNLAEVTPLSDNRPAVDGEVVSVTFEAFENDAPVPGVRAENFELALGEGQALPEFEALIKTVPAGQEGQGDMTFPADFINTDLAGRTVTMKVAVHVIKQRKLPEIDDELAKKAGNFENLDKMREAITMSYKKSRQDLHRSAAQKKLLDKLLSQLDFELPEGVVTQELSGMVTEFVDKLERQGKSLAGVGKTKADVEADLKPQAEALVKMQIFLAAVAAKEELTVTPQEMDAFFYRLSTQTSQDVVLLKRYYEDNGLMIMVRDKLLADKAADFIYANASVTKVPQAEVAAEDKGYGVRD